MKASISYHPKQSKKSPKTGKIPIYLRICVNGKKVESRLSCDVTEKELLKWDPITMRFAERAFFVNGILNSFDQKFQEFLIVNSGRLHLFQPFQIRELLLPRRAQRTVLNYTDDYFARSVKNNSQLSSGTIKNYIKSINHFKKFCKEQGQENLELTSLNNGFALNFKDYLLKTMTEPSAAGIVKKFRTIFSRAVDQGELASNPFKSVKLKVRSPMRQRLSIHHVKALIDLRFDSNPLQEVYRDIFLFSIFSGLAYHDAMELTASNLDERDSYTTKLTIHRAKTDVITEMFLVTPALELIRKFKTYPETVILQKVLPRRSNKEVNLQLKVIGSMAKIPIRLSTHIARHTFRQLLAEARISDIAIIKRMMGHSRSGDIDEVYYSVTESKLLEAKNQFQKYLAKCLTSN